MRKLFSQKTKPKSTSFIMPLQPSSKDDEKPIIISKSTSTLNSIETTDNGEKSKKLFVVVSGIYI